MNRMKFWLVFFLILVFFNVSLAVNHFEKEEYAQRRAKMMNKIKDGIFIILGAQNRTDYYQFYQNNDFMYFSGVEIPNAVLVIDGKKKKSSIFYSISNSNARGLGLKEDLLNNPKKVTGLDQVFPYSELSNYLKKASEYTSKFYTSFKPEELMRECTIEKMMILNKNMKFNEWDKRLTRELQFVEHLKKNYPKVEVIDCFKMIWDLRIIKSAAEIALLRKAGRIGVKAHIDLMKSTYIGMFEYELAALFEYICMKEGAQNLAYNTIVCSAENHPYLHYHRYNRQLKDGDFLVIDAGPDLGYYDIDITISYPANGKFTKRQKEIYQAANAVHEACMSIYKPGLTVKEARKKVNQILVKKGFDLSNDIFTKRAMKGGFGHYVGMAVHDVGFSPRVLKEGMVLANEPYAVFIEENLGVRVEDTILITKDGCENLTSGIPRTVEEIETVMKKDGIIKLLKKAKGY